MCHSEHCGRWNTGGAGRRSNRLVFSTSTSCFAAQEEDIEWDVASFNDDPSLVLAQLGLSDYWCKFRDQEIDMEAFLLLDEQNLKDLGISTIGARKKLHNAITKLRRSSNASAAVTTIDYRSSSTSTVSH